MNALSFSSNDASHRNVETRQSIYQKSVRNISNRLKINQSREHYHCRLVQRKATVNFPEEIDLFPFAVII